MVLLLFNLLFSAAVPAKPALALTFTTTQFTNNDYSDVQPQINDNGWIVWQRNQIEVLLYNGTTTTQLTDWGTFPQINNNGWVVWQGFGVKPYLDIFLYNGSTTTQLTDNDFVDLYAQINDLGQVVWIGWDGHDYEIFLYNDGITRQLTNNDYDDWAPQINNNGWIVWFASDGNDYEIFQYNDGIVTQFTDNDYDDFSPAINDHGWIVWDVGEFFLLYDGNNTTQIPNNSAGGTPQINNSGWVVWHGGDVNNEIFLYDGNTTIQLTNNDYHDHAPQINNNGWVVWYSGGGGVESEIFLTIPSTFISDYGFDFPVGVPDGVGYYDSLPFLTPHPYSCGVVPHPGADFNSTECAGCDKDDPVYSVSIGTIEYAAWAGKGFGRLIIIRHDAPTGKAYVLPDGGSTTVVRSLYAHMSSISTNPATGAKWAVGDSVSRGSQIGTVGDYPSGSGKAYHLHFEIRKARLSPTFFPCGKTKAWIRTRYLNPKRFINMNRHLQ
jgi:murein DD-endopeptidase MepM/ murein hydrolase activator NlpD